MFVSTTAAVSLCLYWSSKSILMAVRTALRGAQRLPFPLFSASTSSFFCFFHIWRQEGEHFALITLSWPVSFIWLTVMRQVKHSMSAHRSRKQIFLKKKSVGFSGHKIFEDDPWLNKIRGRRSDVKVWLLLLIQVCLSDCEGGFIPVLPTLNLAYCFSFLLRMKGIISLLPPPKHPLCNPLIGAAMTIFLSISLWVSVSAEPVTFLWGRGVTPDILYVWHHKFLRPVRRHGLKSIIKVKLCPTIVSFHTRIRQICRLSDAMTVTKSGELWAEKHFPESKL